MITYTLQCHSSATFGAPSMHSSPNILSSLPLSSDSLMLVATILDHSSFEPGSSKGSLLREGCQLFRLNARAQQAGSSAQVQSLFSPTKVQTGGAACYTILGTCLICLCLNGSSPPLKESSSKCSHFLMLTHIHTCPAQVLSGWRWCP